MFQILTTKSFQATYSTYFQAFVLGIVTSRILRQTMLGRLYIPKVEMYHIPMLHVSARICIRRRHIFFLSILSEALKAIRNIIYHIYLLYFLCVHLCIQCVSVDSTSFVIYPELEATEVRFSALKRYLCSFYFRIDNETGRIQ